MYVLPKESISIAACVVANHLCTMRTIIYLVLGFEIRASHLLGSHCTASATSPD
jgi:hypothetical protein